MVNKHFLSLIEWIWSLYFKTSHFDPILFVWRCTFGHSAIFASKSGCVSLEEWYYYFFIFLQALPRHIADFVRRCGVFRWTLRGSGSTEVVCSLLAPPGARYAKIESSWKRFCALHKLKPEMFSRLCLVIQISVLLMLAFVHEYSNIDQTKVVGWLFCCWF